MLRKWYMIAHWRRKATRAQFSSSRAVSECMIRRTIRTLWCSEHCLASTMLDSSLIGPIWNDIPTCLRPWLATALSIALLVLIVVNAVAPTGIFSRPEPQAALLLRGRLGG